MGSRSLIDISLGYWICDFDYIKCKVIMVALQSYVAGNILCSVLKDSIYEVFKIQ